MQEDGEGDRRMEVQVIKVVCSLLRPDEIHQLGTSCDGNSVPKWILRELAINKSQC